MKEYKKPEIRAVVLPDSLMGDVNIGIASKPWEGEGEAPTGAKDNTIDSNNGTNQNTNSSLWDE